MKYAKLLEEYVLVDLLNGVPFEADVKLELQSIGIDNDPSFDTQCRQ
jgi:hypothetical protein